MEQYSTLLSLLSEGKTSFHTVSTLITYFQKNGFELLSLNDLSNADFAPGKKYLYSPYASSLFAFSVGENPKGFRIAMGHTDFPMLKLKSNPELNRNGYLQANVEPYGGLMKETWFDRPLGLAGKVITKSDNPFSPNKILFDSKQPLFIIPNLAPHLKRNEKSADMDIQKEMLPLFALATNDKEYTKDFLTEYIADSIGVMKDTILDYDLYLYIYEEPVFLGLNQEFLTSPRIDNLSSCSAIAESLCHNTPNNCIAVGAFFDNEEIGSRSKQGADSMMFRDVLELIRKDKEFLYNSFSISVDVAHATHPNFTEKSDITNHVVPGNGVVLKSSASQRYVSDSEAGAVCIALCDKNNIKIQRQVNRSGMPGGQTLGPLMSSYLPIQSVDLGIPMLAMHSARETICKQDYTELVNLLSVFYRS